MQLVKELSRKLEQLSKKDSEKTREQIAIICAKFLNEEFESYNSLNGGLRDIIDDLGVMDEIDGIKEPYILHMDMNEIKAKSSKLKDLI